jgi:hypothetical protein
MIFVRMVKVTIVQVVDVAAVTDRGVSTTWPVLVSMVGMGWGGASRHETASSRYSSKPTFPRFRVVRS